MRSISRPGWQRWVLAGARVGSLALLALLSLLACGVAAQPTAAPLPAPAPADLAFTQRLQQLETELRCLVCQNQTLADSSAPLAEDLRREVRELALAGKSDDEIRSYLTARYGDFVLYSPPVKRSTWLLWFGPFLLLAGGAFAWWWIVRRRDVDAGASDHDALRRGLDKLDNA